MKILVRNLDRGVTDAEVLDLFKAYGAVESCVVVKDAATGKSKGFGFVEMPNPREAVKAVKGLNTLKVKGAGIRVKIAEDKASIQILKQYTTLSIVTPNVGRIAQGLKTLEVRSWQLEKLFIKKPGHC